MTREQAIEKLKLIANYDGGIYRWLVDKGRTDEANGVCVYADNDDGNVYVEYGDADEDGYRESVDLGDIGHSRLGGHCDFLDLLEATGVEIEAC